ncbi:MAG TPA: hypothetical protein VKA63_05020, partial [Candidatus Krumholzibacteria bacterium]|nr:hypothetical protein [Candidatus Krumholzibacteria bacterium]
MIMLAATLGLALTVSLSALVFASNSGSGSTTHNESSGKSYNVDKDYEYYASRFGVTVDEAKSQLILQKSAGVLGAELSAKETSSFAGLYLKHSPDFRVVILLTGDEERISTQYVSG